MGLYWFLLFVWAIFWTILGYSSLGMIGWHSGTREFLLSIFGCLLSLLIGWVPVYFFRAWINYWSKTTTSSRAKFVVFEDVINMMGDAISKNDGNGTVKVYSYVELASGQVIQKLTMTTGLYEKVRFAVKSGEEVKLHVADEIEKVLLAFKGSDGRLYSVPIQPVPTLSLSPIILLVSGIFFISILGVGLIMIWCGWTTYKKQRALQLTMIEMNNYLNSLPAAIRLA